MQCVFTAIAKQDLVEIGEYIARDNPHRALTFVSNLEERCQKIPPFPEIGQLHPEYGEGVRIIPYGNYLIVYTIQPDYIRIERILSGFRNLPDILQ